MKTQCRPLPTQNKLIADSCKLTAISRQPSAVGKLKADSRELRAESRELRAESCKPTAPVTIATLLALAVLVFSTIGTLAVAAGQEATENEVKAAFLLNFPKYVEWPAESFAGTNSPILVTIMGDAGLTGEFEKMIVGKTINGRRLELRTLPADSSQPTANSRQPTADSHQPSAPSRQPSADSRELKADSRKLIAESRELIADSHILYISATARRTAELLPQLRGRSILTVSDEAGFLEQGGTIRFARRDRRIRLDVNLTAANESRLKISSKLLSVADTVKGTIKADSRELKANSSER